ncbi:MAG: AmmeMemoRadiSam system protein A [Zoogloeaceae bacterium]|nr:AmmeMemoRadiSam system protein A [Zoogloeaceae bacterium]
MVWPWQPAAINSNRTCSTCATPVTPPAIVSGWSDTQVLDFVKGSPLSAIDAPPRAETELGALLLAHARAAISRELGQAVALPSEDPRLAQRGATFVTLTRDGELRGCIGSLNARRTLGDDVADNALGAAFRDPRFPPVTAAEWPHLQVEVSLLSDPEFLEVKTESEALGRLRPGIDGVIFFNGCRKATFLPQVWAQLPDPREFLAALKRKAGMAGDFWGPNVMLATYQVQKWAENTNS